MTRLTDTYLSGWGSYHPEGRLTNDEVVARIGTTHEWLETNIGILERRKAGPDETIANMGAIACRHALDRAGLGAADIDLVIGSTFFDDMNSPASANRFANELGITGNAFDVKAACSGWFVGLDVAAALLAGGRASRALVVAAEHTAYGIDPTARDGLPFFGDGAAAAVVQRDRPTQGLEVLACHSFSGNDHVAAVEIPNNGHFRMMNGETRTWVEASVVEMAQYMLQAMDIRVSDLRAFVSHQANLRLIERLAGALGVPEDRHWHNVRWAGNTAGAGAPSVLFEGLEEHRTNLVDGDLFLAVTVGAGLVATGTVLRWVSD